MIKVVDAYDLQQLIIKLEERVDELTDEIEDLKTNIKSIEEDNVINTGELEGRVDNMESVISDIGKVCK